MSVVGFDLGNLNCFIAVARGGGIETIANEYSDRCTQSYVSFNDKQRMMGFSAKNQQTTNLENTVAGFKRLLGRSYDDKQVAHEKAFLPYTLSAMADGGVGIEVMYQNKKQVFSPEQVTAMMLTKLKHTAEINLNKPVQDMVLSVPCHYTERERQALLTASQIAGLKCLCLFNEPAAVALAYGIYKQDLPDEKEKPRNVVFLDVGHSNTQLAAVSFNKGKLKVLATTSDSCLGGRDFDKLIADHFTEEFRKKYKVDAKKNKKAYTRLMTESEKTKKLMSANTQPIQLNIECFMEDKDVTGKMCREDFEEMSADLLRRAEAAMVQLLSDCGLKTDDIYAVEVVGGSTRIPAIKALVTKVFKKEASTTLNADEAVARGSALRCAMLSPTFKVREFSVKDVQPYPILLTWQSPMEDESESNIEICAKNAEIPSLKMLTFFRKEQFVLEANYTSKDIPASAHHIGKFTIDGVHPQASGESSKIKVKVRIDQHGLFSVASAMMEEPKTDKTDDEPMDVDGGKTDSPASPAAAKTEPAAEGAEAPAAEPAAEAPADAQAEASMDTDQAASDKKDDAAKNNTDKEAKKEAKKKKVKFTDLSVSAVSHQRHRTDLNPLIEKENQLIQDEKLEKERADSKNAVEEYVYDCRDKLSSTYENFVTEKAREELVALLTKTEDWLYEDGEDEMKQVYIDRLAELKKYGQPIADRYNESIMRPQAFEELGSSIMIGRKFIEQYKAKDEKYIHLTEEDVKKVEKCVSEKEAWYNKVLNAQNQKKPHEAPAVLSSQIRTETQSISSTCTPIMTKPKPKPKVETPPPVKDDKGDKPAEGAAPEATDEAKPNADGDVKPDKAAAEMDLD